jgi:hypothetical protein
MSLQENIALPAHSRCAGASEATYGIAAASAASLGIPMGVIFGLGGIGLNVIQGCRMVGADMIVGVDLQPEARGARPQVRTDPFRQPDRGPGGSRPLPGRAGATDLGVYAGTLGR